MTENTWLIIIGITLIIFELLFGAISGFDIALIGLSLIFGGFVHYFSMSWQYGILVSIVIMLMYFVYFRKIARKKLLVATQKVGIDSLIGKSAVVIDQITAKKPGKVLLDGEVWRAEAKSNFKENMQVEIKNITGVTLQVVKIKKE